jgi:hypothetical protein
LIKASVDMTARDPGAASAGPELLEYAVRQDCVEAIEMLAKSGVDVSVPARLAPSMMALAMESKTEECALALACAGWVPVDSAAGLMSAKSVAQTAREKGYAKAAGAIEAMVEKMAMSAGLPMGQKKAGPTQSL